jgi:hypothetical protein
MWNCGDTGFVVISMNVIIMIFGAVITAFVIDLVNLISDMVCTVRGKEIPERKQIYWP